MNQPAKRCRFSTVTSSSTLNEFLPSMRTTNMDRATLKIEIPFTDHAHCIGRQGNQIQSIMSATDTHIHFPDGNREPNGTKSNQVSITGTVSSIEEARKRIREILPMSLKFLIPPTELINIINDDYPLFKNVRERFRVIVLPRPYAKTGDVYCIVRGLINQPGLSEATEYLIQAFYAQTAHIKDKLNVTTTVRTRKDKIGKLVTVQSQEYNCEHLFRARAIILGLSEQNNNHILPISTNGLFDLNQTATFLSDLSFPTASPSSLFFTSSSPAASTNHMTDSILIPIEACYIPPTQHIDTVLVPIVETNMAKKPSPIGHERSSSRNLDQESVVWPTNNDRMPSLFVFDSSTQQTLKPTDMNNLESIDNSLVFPIQDNCSAKLLTLLRSINLEKYWSTFERNEIDYCTFLSMTDHDLTQIGIEAFGARRRMQQAIAVRKAWMERIHYENNHTMLWPISIDINKHNYLDHNHRLIQIASNNQTAFDSSINNSLPLLIDDANNPISYYLPLFSLLPI
ncbi:unnamed protein product [Rotaria magnacalcarata]|uniref:SAM domain-containing protein n=1 Tax=Rotaria magnacalcarata TaxID=392030 RepID=A0A8S2LH65_9BILA|nr:unnamed protein product [Rotaria magnacalcarata]